jgi:hypothetical protein
VRKGRNFLIFQKMALRVPIRFRIVKEINQVLQEVPSPSFKTYFTIAYGSSPKRCIIVEYFLLGVTLAPELSES